LLPVGLLIVVVAIAVSPLVGAGLAVVGGLIALPFVYREYQANRPNRTAAGAKSPRADPPNNRSLLR
jgi:hypothetical protein